MENKRAWKDFEGKELPELVGKRIQIRLKKLEQEINEIVVNVGGS